MPALLALNNAHATELSPHDAGSFAALLQAASFVLVAEGAAALLVAMDQDAWYDSHNFRWFKDRYERFMYIDRVVVAPEARGCGAGRALYGALTAHAAARGHVPLCCEVNVAPPNPASACFHAALGFAEVGRAVLPNRNKEVAYLVREG